MMRLAITFLFILLLFGCSHQNLSTTDKEVVENLQEQMLNVNQLIDELDLLLIEFQKNDELQEAIEMMETASSEANEILGVLKALMTEANSLNEFTNRYEAALIQYSKGLQLQIEGMENWDAQKTTKGFKQTELAKNNLKEYHQEFEKSFK